MTSQFECGRVLPFYRGYSQYILSLAIKIKESYKSGNISLEEKNVEENGSIKLIEYIQSFTIIKSKGLKYKDIKNIV